jgi:hypothetical protein
VKNCSAAPALNLETKSLIEMDRPVVPGIDKELDAA